MVSTRAALWFTWMLEQQSFVYGVATRRLAGDGVDDRRRPRARRVARPPGCSAATRGEGGPEGAQPPAVLVGVPPHGGGVSAAEHGVDRRWVVEAGVDLHRAHAEVGRDEVLVGLGRSRPGVDHGAGGADRGSVGGLGPHHQGDGGPVANGPEAASITACCSTPTSPSAVCTGPAPIRSATTRPGSGWVHAPFGTPTQATRSSRPGPRRRRRRPTDGVDHGVEQLGHLAVVGPVAAGGDADEDGGVRVRRHGRRTVAVGREHLSPWRTSVTARMLSPAVFFEPEHLGGLLGVPAMTAAGAN